MSNAFGHDIPRLSWLGGKQYVQSQGSRKNRPGEKYLHAQANRDNIGFDIERAIAKSEQKLLPGKVGGQ